MNIVLLALLHVVAQDDPKEGSVQATRESREKAHKALVLELLADESAGKEPRWENFAPRFLKLAEDDPTDWIGFDGLFWLIAAGHVDRPEFSQAMARVAKHHAKGDRMQRLCGWLVSPLYFGSASEAVEGLLREVIATNQFRPIQAEACFSLAVYFHNKAEFARVLRRPDGADLARRVCECWGRDYLTRLNACDPQKLMKAASQQTLRGLMSYPQFWTNHPTLGKRAPMIDGSDVDGKPMALSGFQGKVVMLSFWGPWCPPCVALIPHEQSLAERFARRPFAMLGVANDKDRSTVKRMLADKQVTWRSWWDTEDSSAPISQSWNVRGWPTTYVLDHRGVIRYKNIRGQDLDFAIEALLLGMNES